MATKESTTAVAVYLCVVGLVSTVLAALTGIALSLALGFPLSMMAMLFVWPQFPLWLWNEALLATPVTLVLLPVTAAFFHKQPTLLYFALPFLGTAGGAAAIILWIRLGVSWPEFAVFAKANLSFELPGPGYGSNLTISVGAVAGLVAGLVFSAATREMRR